ncbi:MAG: insulinase family protein [Bacteroidota bacterium]|nr:insulinase family protein [Bacteroidota bacterium]
MKRLFALLLVISATLNLLPAMSQTKLNYESFPGDPLNTRIYTLPNGLKIFLTVYKEAPRIQTYIAVHTGSKMDPPETTGLAHYFEHMMFKGTQEFGTTDWEKEKPLIQQIEDLFEVYRTEKNDAKRAAIYHQIDSLSYEASKYAIPNEYDKLMDAIGSQGSNAGTSNDYTIFMENIPSNEIENWARIECDRFSNPVLRLFHTELETVYEEKNMSLTNDNRKVNETMMKVLFPNHPYGTQTTLGEAEHLKNPSMKNIRKFFSEYYVPNNIAVCMSGDFDPDQTIGILEKYFGQLKYSPVSPLKYGSYQPLTKPVTKEITGLEAENVRIGYGLDFKANDDRSNILGMISTLLSNDKAGLIDLNLNQSQKVLSAAAYDYQLADYGMMILSGKPRTGQTLEEVRDLLLQQMELLKKGEFPDWMLEAAINNAKLSMMKQFEGNQGRAMTLANAYLNDIPYSKVVSYLNDIEKITKKDVVDFANKYFGNGYVVIFKRQGKPEEIAKINKPPITPVQINRDSESDFLKKIRETKTADVEPVFLDYQKDVIRKDLPGPVRILYKENTENATFQLLYYFKMGRNNDRVMNFAMSYLPFLGTSKHSAEELKQEFYRLACSMNISSSEEETQIGISGLSANFEKALALLEEVMMDPKADPVALDNLVMNTLKSRKDAKSNQNEVFNALVNYGTYGSSSPYKNILSETELKALTADQLVKKIKDLKHISHQVLYYGPEKPEGLCTLLTKYHKTGKINPVPEGTRFTEQEIATNKILFAPYDAKQARIETIAKNGQYESRLAPDVALYNMYFGGNIVFQELREKRALAYTSYSRYQEPNELNKSYLSTGYIATQNDKVPEAIQAFDHLFNEMPETEITFNVSKNALLNKIRTERITRMGVLWNYIKAEKLGLHYDIRKDIFERVKIMNLSDIASFNKQYIQNKAKKYLILGRESEIDLKSIQKSGELEKLSLEDIFGY